MSYSLYQQCGKCSKREQGCKDVEKVQKAISEIHMSNDGSHLGYGFIMHYCMNSDTNVEVK